LRAKTIVRITGRWIVAATKHLASEFQVKAGGGEPGELKTIITILGPQKCTVRQRLVSEIPVVRMLIIKVANGGVKTTKS
jgi:hypothetical protein